MIRRLKRWWHHLPREEEAAARDVAGVMNQVFNVAANSGSPEGASLAYLYAQLLFDDDELRGERELTSSPFYVALSTGGHGSDIATLTRRGTLVSDTLLLTHEPTEPLHHIGFSHPQTARFRADTGEVTRGHLHSFGIRCPDIQLLGEYLRAAEPLFRAGLAWYLPQLEMLRNDRLSQAELIRQPGHRYRRSPTIDYVIRAGRAIEVSSAPPETSRAVRFIMTADIPFIDGVSLAEYSKITMGEFNGHMGIKTLIQSRINQLDAAMEADQVDREIRQIGLEIREGLLKATDDIKKAARTKAVSGAKSSVAGAACVTGALVAVAGPYLEQALAVLGVSGGIWAYIDAKAQHDARQVVEDKWYYLWVLQEAGRREL